MAPSVVLPSRRQRLMMVLCLALSVACADDPVPRRVVLQRAFDWTLVPPAAAGDGVGAAPARPAPPGRSFGADELLGWQLLGSAERRREGDVLVLEGRGSARLVAPPSLVDTRVHDELQLSVSGSAVETLRVVWSEDGMRWLPRDGADLAGVDGADVVRRGLLLDHVRVTTAAGVLPGLGLTVRGADDAPWTLRLHALTLHSVFDTALREGLEQGSFARDGVLRPGLAFAAPGGVQAPLVGGPGQRLELWFAGAASADALVLHVDVGDSAWELPLRPDAGWTSLRVPLDELPGDGSAMLRLSVPDGAGVVLVGGPLRLGPGTDARPDVLLWLVDTLRADRLSSYGYGAATDPHLSALAAQGVRFERVYAASNWTRPSVSTLHTGVGPERHGNQLPGLAVDPELPTLAQQFAAAGYLTVSFNTNWQVGEPSGLDAGFDVEVQPRAFPALEPASSLTSAQIAGPLEELLSRHVGDRLFVSVHCLDPHAPYVPPESDLEAVRAGGATAPEGPVDVALRFRQRSPRYDAEVRHADRQLGRLDALLGTLGTRDDTLLTLLSDHGEAFFEHGTWAHWRGLHDEEVAVPWVLRWPGGLPAGRVLSAPVGHVDVAPTLLGLVGLTPPAAWDGRDLSAVCRGDAPDRDGPVLVVDAVSGAQEDFGTRRLAAVAGPLKLLARVDADGRPVPEALYDLSADPGEQHDLLAAGSALPPHLLDALVSHLARDGRRRDAVLDELSVDPEQRRWMAEMGYLR